MWKRTYFLSTNVDVFVANLIWLYCARNMNEIYFLLFHWCFSSSISLLTLLCTFSQRFAHSRRLFTNTCAVDKLWNVCVCIMISIIRALKLTSKLSMASRTANEVFVKWLPDKFNTFNWSNESKKSIGMSFISAIDSDFKWRKFWN